MNKNDEYCMQIVQKADKTHYLSTLYAPVNVRPHLYALYAFMSEISSVRAKISEPLPGEVRLQWWRDVVNSAFSNEVHSNPIAAALCDTIQQFNLPLNVFIDMINAQLFDIYNDPMPSLNDLEGYAGETAGAIIILASMILNKRKTSESAHLAGHAGCALTIAHILKNVSIHARQGQVFIPQDLLTQHSLAPQDVLNRVQSPAMKAVLQALMARAIWHVEQIKCERTAICCTLSPAFLPVALVRKQIHKMQKQSLKLLQQPIDLCPLTRIFTLCAAARCV